MCAAEIVTCEECLVHLSYKVYLLPATGNSETSFICTVYMYALHELLEFNHIPISTKKSDQWGLEPGERGPQDSPSTTGGE